MRHHTISENVEDEVKDRVAGVTGEVDESCRVLVDFREHVEVPKSLDMTQCV